MPKHTATVCQNADISKYFYLKFYKTLVLIKHQVQHLRLRKVLLWLDVTNNTLLSFFNNRKPRDTTIYEMIKTEFLESRLN